MTAFFLCLAAAGAAGADCNGSARGNGGKIFLFLATSGLATASFACANAKHSNPKPNSNH